jgi:hypothetical protein
MVTQQRLKLSSSAAYTRSISLPTNEEKKKKKSFLTVALWRKPPCCPGKQQFKSKKISKKYRKEETSMQLGKLDSEECKMESSLVVKRVAVLLNHASENGGEAWSGGRFSRT